MDDKVHAIELQVTEMKTSMGSIQQRQYEMQEDIKDIKKIAVSIHEIAIETKKMREDVNDNSNRLKEIEGKPSKVHEIALEMKQIREDVDDNIARLKYIESKPVKRWDAIVDKILTYVVGAILGYIALKL